MIQSWPSKKVANLLLLQFREYTSRDGKYLQCRICRRKFFANAQKSMMIPSKCTFVFRLSIYSRYLEHSDPIHVDLTIIPIVTNRFKRSVFGVLAC